VVSEQNVSKFVWIYLIKNLMIEKMLNLYILLLQNFSITYKGVNVKIMGVPSSNFKIEIYIVSVQVLWRKDEKNFLKSETEIQAIYLKQIFL